MIYIHLNHHLHTLEPPATFNFNQYLKGKTPFSLKSLLVIYYYYKERKKY